jgi:anti-sigma-K factor RskA
MLDAETNNNEYEWEDQLADYALGVMDTGAAAEFERKLGECRAHVTMADQYTHAIGLVGLAVVPVEPPVGHKDRFMARLGTTAQETPPAATTATGRTGPLPILGAGATPPHGLPAVSATAPLPVDTGPVTGAHVIDLAEYRARRSVGSVVSIVASVAAALLIVVGLWGWFSTRNEINDLQTQLARAKTDVVRGDAEIADLKNQLEAARAALNIPPDYVPVNVAGQAAQPNASGVVFINPRTNDVQLVAQGLSPLPDTKVYEMWWLPVGSGAPVKAGTFQTDASGMARHAVKPPQPLTSYKGVAVSEEQAPGGDQPQGPIVLVGTYTTP